MQTNEVIKYSFPPIITYRPQVLILGSMPSEKSLQSQEYYAHPANCFWSIMSCLFGGSVQDSYAQRKKTLQFNNIAVWDVLRSCSRDGSLDSAIVNTSIVTNDFASLLATYPSINLIAFNGTKASSVYKQHVLPYLPAALQHITSLVLPSTSPAMARLSQQQKLQQWAVIKS